MKWKEKSENNIVETESDLNDLENERYSPLRNNLIDGVTSIFSDLLKPSHIIIGVVVLILILGLALFIPKKAPQQNKEIEMRLKQIEARLAELERHPTESAQTENREQKIENLKARVERMETSLTARINDLAQTIKKPATKSAEAVSVKASAQPAGTPAQKSKAAAPRSHVVQVGETLYSIAKQYGISVETLSRINKLTPAHAIHPGDRLIVEAR